MLKTIKVIHLAPGESLLILTQPAPTPAPSIPASEPAMAPPPRMAPRPAPAAENYAHLFAAKSAEPVAKNKDQPLKSLLERIATCR